MVETKKKRNYWKPPEEWFAPTDPKEFMFCFSLMDAAYSGRMATPNPSKVTMFFEDNGGGRATDGPSSHEGNYGGEQALQRNENR